MKLPNDIDKECIILCESLNKIKGIRTTESCCGHGRDPFKIWFWWNDSSKSLMKIIYNMDYDWLLKRVTGKYPTENRYFLLQGPSGDFGYTQANELAARLRS
jgi:tRNA(Phe) wybutosine-synthesizing methylase Tyw3